ncbi:MAG: ATP-binding cassette domain-containing protein, partial [Nocardioides sp.]|nr:ATP-binding cassette domain-containing protein [Nocardioides sp.]
MTQTPTTGTCHVALGTNALRLGYGTSVVIDEVSIELPAGQITAIVGPNGCGKSTLLRGLARLMDPLSGHVHLDGADLARLSARTIATRLGLLPQQPTAPDGITVADLVG